MLSLGIESSCDETAAAIIEDGRVVRSSIIASQIQTHLKFGGVVPEVAAREHLVAIDRVVDEAFAKAQCSIEDIDHIAVTRGPGLIGPLLVGVCFAKGLGTQRGLPVTPVDHVHAHIHGALLGIPREANELFPALALVISGGHSNLYFMPDPVTFQLIAYSLDDACGECFDKVAKMYKLGYPGGPIVERIAKQGDPKAVAMPRMVAEADKLAFSYSGLKTHMANLGRKLGYPDSPLQEDDERLANAMASFQDAALEQLVRKVRRAHQDYPAAKHLLVAGGVAANQRFRKLATESLQLECHFPALQFCSDNAAMIAALGYHLFKANQSLHDPKHQWDAYSRYRYEEHFGV